MHIDLVAICNVWSADSSIDRLRAEHEALANAARTGVSTLAEAEGSLVAATRHRDALALQTRANDRELSGYVEKRDRTRTMINTGTAPDYAAAERQLAQVIVIVDQLETKSLELMDALDAGVASVVAAEKLRAKAVTALAEARMALGARDAPIREEITVFSARQKLAAAELPPDYRGAYAEQRRRKRPAVTNTKEGGICVNCGMKARPQLLSEVQMDRAVHACTGCGAWFLP